MTLGTGTFDFESSEISCSSIVHFKAMPDQILTCPADFFFGSYDETNLGIRNFSLAPLVAHFLLLHLWVVAKGWN